MIVQQFQAMTGPSGRRWPTEQDWIDKRDLLEHLYRDLDKTLKEVSEVLIKKHNFYATPKMYKSRFKKWGLRKNLTASESEEVKRQAHAGRAHLPIVGGRQLGSKLLKAHLRTQGQTYEMVEGHIQTVFSRYVRAPDSIYISESALYETWRYADGSLEQQIWDFSSMRGLFNVTADWGVLLSHASQEISRKRNYALGFDLLDECCSRFRPLLQQQQEVALIWGILVPMVELDNADGQPAAKSFIKFVAGMCSLELGSSHPLTKLCQNLQSMGTSLTKESTAAILLSQMGQIRKRRGPGYLIVALNRMLIFQWLNDYNLISDEFCMAGVEDAILESKVSKEKGGKSALEYIWAGLLFISWLKKKQRHAKAEAVLQDIINWHQTWEVPMTGQHLRPSYCCAVAEHTQERDSCETCSPSKSRDDSIYALLGGPSITNRQDLVELLGGAEKGFETEAAAAPAASRSSQQSSVWTPPSIFAEPPNATRKSVQSVVCADVYDCTVEAQYCRPDTDVAATARWIEDGFV